MSNFTFRFLSDSYEHCWIVPLMAQVCKIHIWIQGNFCKKLKIPYFLESIMIYWKLLEEIQIISVVSICEVSTNFYRAKNITTSEWFEIMNTFTTTCGKNILNVSDPTIPGSHIMVFLSFAYSWCNSCFSNTEILDKIRIHPSEISHIFPLSR